MQFTITNAGIAAANAASAGGPKINITTFKVGTAVAYTPLVSDVNLRGTVLYTGVPANYAVISAHVVSFMLTMDDTVGDFSYGEVGLFLADGTLFALGTLATVQAKHATNGGSPGDVISYDARLNFSQLAAIIEFPITQLLNGKIPEVASIDLLSPPVICQNNAYIVHSGDDVGTPVLAIRHADYDWRFLTHNTRAVAAGVVGSGQAVATATINAAGTGYGVNNILTVQGGTAHVAAQITVTSVNGAGGITGFTVSEDGVYTVTPTSPASVSGGSGTGATFNLTFGSAVSQYEIVSADVANKLPSVQAGKYIIQITSGPLAGACRYVTSSKLNMVKWAEPFGSIPLAGATFDVYQSDSSIIADARAAVIAAENALAYALVFGGFGN